MKHIFYIASLMVSMLFITSCEEVVEVDLDTAPPRLVVDASINWVKGTSGNEQTIKLTTTTGYYNPAVPVVSGAIVFITNSTGNVFDFIEVLGTGKYVCTNFVPQIGETYRLTVINGNQTYTATETMFATPAITSVIQDNEGGFLNDEIEVRFFFQDPPGINNWYMVRTDTDLLPYPEYDVNSDQFTQGNEMFEFFSDEDLKAGDVLNFKLYGTSERFYNYMSLLIELADGGGPFSAPLGTARGNLINQTNEANYALGYFRLGEVEVLDYTVQP